MDKPDLNAFRAWVEADPERRAVRIEIETPTLYGPDPLPPRVRIYVRDRYDFVGQYVSSVDEIDFVAVKREQVLGDLNRAQLWLDEHPEEGVSQ